MGFTVKIWLGILVVVGFDVIGSISSRSLQFDYTKLMWASFLIYLVAGYWGAYRRGFAYGLLLSCLVGLADATIGWFVSQMIGPFTRTAIPSLNPLVVAVVIVTVTLTASVFGLVGAGLCKLFGHSRSAAA
jgi:hypothetical protein